MRLIYHFILFISLLLSSKPQFELFELSPHIINQIENNKTITIKTDRNYPNGEHYQAYTIVNSNIESVFDAVENFENYPNFMPRFDSVQTIQNTDSTKEYIFNIILPLNILYKYKIKSKEYIGTDSAWLSWETIPWEGNSINETWGQWYITPYNGSKNRTLIQYQVFTDPGYIPFGFEWIVNIMTKKTLPKTIENLKVWIENEK